MPWRHRSVLEARLEFVNLVKKGGRSVAEAAREWGVSRQTAHRWLKRYDLEGEEGLRDRSKAPRVIPHKTPDEMEERVLQVRRQYPTWGAEEDPGLADLSGAWSDVACGQHDGRDSGACGDGDSAEDASEDARLDHAGESCERPERRLARGLQGAVPAGQWPVL